MLRSIRGGRVAVLASVAVAVLAASMAFGHVKSFKKGYKKQPKPSLTIQYTDQDPATVPPPGAGPPPPPAIDPVDFFSGVMSFATRNPGPCGEANRTVRVEQVGVGTLGEATTADDGTWQLSAEDVATGEYRARVVKEKITLTIPPVPGVSEGHIHKYVCKPSSPVSTSAGP